MPRPDRRRPALQAGAAAATVLACATLWTARPLAHKPITSPYTFTEHVLPILRDHCQACHVTGGVAPMALETHVQTVPWAESIRLELISGHMPPWPVDAPRGRFRHARTPSAREIDVMLTWASGGTPEGDPPRDGTAQTNASPRPAPHEAAPWALGTPDQIVDLPARTLDAGVSEDVATFTVPLAADAPRALAAVDVRPGAPAMVRGVAVTVRADDGAAGAESVALAPEVVAASWVPGEAPVRLPDGVGVRVPSRARLEVRVRYKKTWQYERQTLTDTTTLGLYFARANATSLMGVTIGASATEATPGMTVASTLRILALSVVPGAADAGAVVEVRRPDGTREALATLRPERGWARRYWFEEPPVVPGGSVVTVRPRAVTAPSLTAPVAASAGAPIGASASALAAGPRIRLHVVPD